MLRIEHFDPRDRAREKQLAREEDARLLASRSVSADELSHQNGFFSKADLSHAVIVGRRKAELIK
jgi:hypothetical protein